MDVARLASTLGHACRPEDAQETLANGGVGVSFVHNEAFGVHMKIGVLAVREKTCSEGAELGDPNSGVAVHVLQGEVPSSFDDVIPNFCLDLFKY